MTAGEIAGEVIALLGGGGLGALTGVLLVRDRLRLGHEGVVVHGFIAGSRETGRAQGDQLYAPEVRFTTREGRDVTHLTMDRSHRPWQAGRPVVVRYRPDKPEDVVIGDHVPVAGWFLITCLFVVIGVAGASGLVWTLAGHG
ncbi:DUF3592 domain-containing protein [Streptomyces sp. NPDC087300]|uniref:DUF3592 domain-containing protein n=1 Tax=Streptomyces sp. NPDC087300 TaxID=3365780 RepID=UPI00382B5EA2